MRACTSMALARAAQAGVLWSDVHQVGVAAPKFAHPPFCCGERVAQPLV